MPARHEGRQSAAEYTAADEAMLREGRLAARVAVLSDRTVSLGVAQGSEAEPAKRARAAGLPVVQRTTGGVGLLHLPGDIVWSVVLPRDHPDVGRDYARAFARLGRGVVDGLAETKLSTAWGAPLGLSEEYCLLAPRGDVLRVGEQVLGGAAQHATRSALLHHGVIALRTDPNALRELFGLPVEAIRRLTSLRELGVRWPAEDVAAAIAARLPPPP